MKSIRLLGSGLAVLAALTLSLGCSQRTKDTPKGDAQANKEGKTGKEAHAHGTGPHDGTVADWGGGKYHIEFTVDHDKQEARVYILGPDEKTPAPIKAKDGQLLLTIKEPPFQVMLKAAPQKGDLEGTASCFAGTHEKLGKRQEFAGTVSGEVNGTPYAGDFQEEPAPPAKKQDKK